MTSKILLLLISFLAAISNNLPDYFYIFGIGPFEVILVIAILFCLQKKYIIINHVFTRNEFRHILLPLIFLIFSFYIADIFGLIRYGNFSINDLLEPIRLFLYIFFILVLKSLNKNTEDFYQALFSYILGVLFISIQSYIHPGDDSFVGGLPVLFNPNVVANLIGYAFICIILLTNSNFRFINFLLVFLFSYFQFLTFSKAGWIMLIISWIQIVKFYKINKFILLVTFLSIFYLALKFEIFDLLNIAFETKIAASVDSSEQVGSFTARLGFLKSSIMTLSQFPFGIGNHYFSQIHDEHAKDLGVLYLKSDSPHSAVGYLMISSGLLGLISFFYFIFINIRLITTKLKPILIHYKFFTIFLFIHLLLSMFFQIELLTQPFIYFLIGITQFLFKNNDMYAKD